MVHSRNICEYSGLSEDGFHAYCLCVVVCGERVTVVVLGAGLSTVHSLWHFSVSYNFMSFFLHDLASLRVPDRSAYTFSHDTAMVSPLPYYSSC